jgi:4'-phosphopantetheinyl transferase
VDVEVWLADASAVAADAGPALTEQEHRHAAGFVAPAARDHFVASRALQRALGSRLLGTTARQIAFDRRCAYCGHDKHGKPRLAEARQIDYSVSHSGTLVALAYAPRGRVGLDLEADERLIDPDVLLPRVATAAERQALAVLPVEARRPAFMRLWTRKEAVVKLTGHGLALPFEDFSADGFKIIIGAPGCAGEPVWISDLAVDVGYTAALATTPESAEVVVRRITAWHQALM